MSRQGMDFSVANNLSDVVLVVEERELHVNRTILSQASPVFERMFNGDFKEKSDAKVVLPEKSYEEVKELLFCIYPSEMREVTGNNVDFLLKLADEYQITSIRRKCEQLMISICETCNDPELVVEYMYTAQQFQLKDLMNTSTDVASKMTFKGKYYDYIDLDDDRKTICNAKYYSLLSKDTQIMFLSKRVNHLEVTFEIG